ncbi:MAG: diaminopimelate decarboxylase [Phycisphaerae bacterium]
MDEFTYHDGRLRCERVDARELAQRYETPLYAYSHATLCGHFDRLRSAFAALDALICFSVKSCPNTHLCRLLAERGAGFDVVSGGELHRVFSVGADATKIVFAGVGKSDRELREALAAGAGWLNAESESELECLTALARQAGARPRVALRVNPDVDARTHEYTTTGRKETKFGIDYDRAVDVFERFGRDESIRLTGVHLHIGSPVNEVSAYVRAIRRVLALIDELRTRGHVIETIDIGGGFGAHYAGGEGLPAADYAGAIVPLLAGRGLKVIVEPGRAIAANAGILLTRVVHVKTSGARRFVIVDTAMNDLIRPALYGAYHFIWPVDAGERVPATRGAEQPFDDLVLCDVVGPVCESGDFLARDRRLPPVQRGDLLAVFSVGAYGMSMSSQYNSRPRAAEVLVEGDQARLIRRRETYSDLLIAEQV